VRRRSARASRRGGTAVEPMRPGLDLVGEALAELHGRFGSIVDGQVATYIPALSRADPNWFGIGIVSIAGHQYCAGDVDVPFTLQSLSKPFVYALALAERGLDEVTRWVGAEPSGEAFNAISLEPDTGRPANPMINAGAIVITALVSDAHPGRFARIVDVLSAFAGRPLDFDDEVYVSEADTGDRNRALAHLMRAAGSLPGDVEPAVDGYFRQCAVVITVADLAVMAATLANSGRNPVTGVQVVPAQVAEQVLSVMASCGMYDAAGDWLLRVGLPAKSGVSGGVIAVSPSRFGVAAFSPPLDAVGNSVRGVAAMQELSSRFGLHLMHAAQRTAEPVTLAQRIADRIAVIAVQGGLDFTTTEQVLYVIGETVPDDPGWLICDLSRVTALDVAAEAMLTGVLSRLSDRGHRVAVVGEPGSWASRLERRWSLFEERADAIGWAEGSTDR
jgi:glutaminase